MSTAIKSSLKHQANMLGDGHDYMNNFSSVKTVETSSSREINNSGLRFFWVTLMKMPEFLFFRNQQILLLLSGQFKSVQLSLRK